MGTCVGHELHNRQYVMRPWLVEWWVLYVAQISFYCVTLTSYKAIQAYFSDYVLVLLSDNC